MATHTFNGVTLALIRGNIVEIPAEAIVNAAELRGANVGSLPTKMTDLILLARQHHGGIAGVLHASVSEQLVGLADMPVMIVPEDAAPWRSNSPYNTELRYSITFRTLPTR